MIPQSTDPLTECLEKLSFLGLYDNCPMLVQFSGLTQLAEVAVGYTVTVQTHAVYMLPHSVDTTTTINTQHWY